MADEAPKAGQVVAMLGADRPEDALKRINEALANEEPTGIIAITVSKTGDVDVRIYGAVTRYQLAWAGAQLTHEAMTPNDDA